MLQGQYVEAMQLYQLSLSTMVKIGGAASVPVAELLNRLGEVFRLEGKYQAALQVKQQALATLEQIKGSDQTECAKMSNNVGLVLQVCFTAHKLLD